MKNFLLASLKRTNNILKIISSDENIIDTPELSLSVSYQASYKLEENEWYFLDNFSKSKYSNQLINDSFESTSFNQLVKSDFNKIKLFWIYQDNQFYFQKILPTQFLKKKWLRISDEPSLHKEKKVILLNNWADAVYSPSDDKLYFKEISKIKVFFKGIEEIYREATDIEVEEFLDEKFINLTNDFSADNVKVPNRKRLALAKDTLENFSKKDRKYIFKYIRDYCPDISITKNKAFNIGSEDELTQVLWGIEQRYYTTHLGSEKRLANSIITL